MCVFVFLYELVKCSMYQIGMCMVFVKYRAVMIVKWLPLGARIGQTSSQRAIETPTGIQINNKGASRAVGYILIYMSHVSKGQYRARYIAICMQSC